MKEYRERENTREWTETERNLGEVRKEESEGEGGRPRGWGGRWGRVSSSLARGGRLKAESQQAVEERNKS